MEYTKEETKTLEIIRILVYKKITWTQNLTILSLALLIGVGTYFYSKAQGPKYYSNTTFITGNNDQKSSLGNLAGQLGMVLPGNSDILSGDNITIILTSKSLVKKSLLSTNPHLKSSFLDSYIDLRFKGKLNMNKAQKNTRYYDSIVDLCVTEIIDKNIEIIKPDKKLPFIQLQVTSGSEMFAKFFADELLDNISDFYFQHRNSLNQKNIALLTRTLDSAENELSMVLRQIGEESAFSNFTTNPIDKRRYQELQIKLTILTSLNAELVKNLEVTKAVLNKEVEAFQIIDSSGFPLKKVYRPKLNGLVLSIVTLVIGYLMLIVYNVIKELKKSLY